MTAMLDKMTVNLLAPVLVNVLSAVWEQSEQWDFASVSLLVWVSEVEAAQYWAMKMGAMMEIEWDCVTDVVWAVMWASMV